ncbi:hypothetical protein AVEN_153601-1 [Araneus ventricosus]|uniref:Uncharacterized protein n=1 Tax=Araneus ventricosus TaxID=182803 RepID=A0A4Y2BNQ2_ARAVE|nr:hypothetical protein AVEN_153601-1 [Araneus ventricosus]
MGNLALCVAHAYFFRYENGLYLRTEITVSAPKPPKTLLVKMNNSCLTMSLLDAAVNKLVGLRGGGMRWAKNYSDSQSETENFNSPKHKGVLPSLSIEKSAETASWR